MVNPKPDEDDDNNEEEEDGDPEDFRHRPIIGSSMVIVILSIVRRIVMVSAHQCHHRHFDADSRLVFRYRAAVPDTENPTKEFVLLGVQ